MPFEEIKQMDATQIPVGKLLYMIGKGYSVYVNRNLEEFGINTTQLHLLFEIAHESNINQEMIGCCKIYSKTRRKGIGEKRN